MKKISDYRRLLGVDKTADLKELKTVYRNFMKECHPDKFVDNEEEKLKAEEKSKKVIEAYHFLVSIAPETIEANKEEYMNTINSSLIADFKYKGVTLVIIFTDGVSYEYHDVPNGTYKKFLNSDARVRFAKRHIYNEFVYRKLTKAVEVEA